MDDAEKELANAGMCARPSSFFPSKSLVGRSTPKETYVFYTVLLLKTKEPRKSGFQWVLAKRSRVSLKIWND